MERRDNILESAPDVVSMAVKISVLTYILVNATVYRHGHTYETWAVSSSSVNLSSSDASIFARTDGQTLGRCIIEELENPYSEYL